MPKYISTQPFILENTYNGVQTKINNTPDKIISLKKIKDSDFKDIYKFILNYIQNNIKTKKDIARHKNKLDEVYQNITLEKLSVLYFEPDNSRVTNNAIIQKILYVLRAKRFILLPLVRLVESKSINNKTVNLYNLNELDLIFTRVSKNKNKFDNFITNLSLNTVKKYSANTSKVLINIQNVYMASDIENLENFTPQLHNFLIDIIYKYPIVKNIKREASDFKKSLKVISDYFVDNIKSYDWNLEFSKTQIIVNNDKYKYFNDLYLGNYINEDWVKYGNEYLKLKSEQVKHIDRYIKGVREWLFYLKEHYPTLSPKDLDRTIHIRNITNKNSNITTFYEIINNLEISAQGKNTLLIAMEEYFEFIKFEYIPELKVALSKSDRFKDNKNNSITSRKRIPSYIINTAKEILLEGNFDFNKKYQDENTQLRIFDDNGDKVYWHGLTIITYILLTLPIRNKQARWLDSGELDEFIIDFDNMAYIKNPNKYAIKGRKKGCLQIEEDYFTNKKYFVLFINTNKTGKYYTIPYVPEELIQMIKEQIIWNQLHNTQLTKPIPAIEKNKKWNSYGITEDSCPLFLFPSFKNGIEISATSESVLSTFYWYLMKETEQRILENTGEKILLAKPLLPNENRRKTVFDIHSLRVSGITSLIEAGVPIEIVSQFVAGHSSIAMTLYYNKNTPEEISESIQKLNDANPDIQKDIEKLKTINDFDKILFNTSQEFKTGAFKTLKDNTGYWNIGLSGICPVSCSDVGREDKCCAKCKYWITGTPFLIGQTTELNDLMFDINKKAQSIKTLNKKYRQSKNTKIKGEIELLTEGISLMVEEWGIRYKFIKKSLSMLDIAENDGIDTKNALLTNNKLNLDFSIEGNFGMAFNICRSSEIIEEFDNSEAQLELEMFINKILMHNNIEPFLLRLESEESLKAANLFSEYILKNYNNSHIEELINGRLQLDSNHINAIENKFYLNTPQQPQLITKEA